ncbi:universal stress protein [Carboxylicivirga sp. N1Y132]|uniref:Universal stress protein n=1 Tax=Carboxylicivirga marina TaxID=2800988 RepID=A0ABS1HEM4_9BACT|nr:universal stress protein [Carboxylicivirga marina]
MLHLADKTIEVMVANGSCADSLIDVANQLNAYMIVMGSHSRKWFENTTIGSVIPIVYQVAVFFAKI